MRQAQYRNFSEAGIEPFIEDKQLRISLGFTDINLAEKMKAILDNAGMKARYICMDEDLGEIYQITDVENDFED